MWLGVAKVYGGIRPGGLMGECDGETRWIEEERDGEMRWREEESDGDSDG